jgi:APA family basic amino acid/polyamine antiporter
VLRIGLVNAALLFAIVVIGLVTEFHPERVTDSIDLGTQPPWEDVLFAATVAAIIVIGIESASGLAGEIRVGTRGLRRVVVVASTAIVALFVGISVVAVMVVPVENGMTALGTTYLEDPVRGVVEGLSPEWLRSALLAAVGTAAFFMLTQAVNGNMLGLSRVTYSLATNRQIPSAVGRLGPHSTPYVAILAAAVIVLGLAASSSVTFLVGIFAFGAMISTTIAHASIIVLRFREPDRRRAFRVPFSFAAGKGSVPLPAAFGVVLGLAAWVSVLVVHEGARYVGGAWMLAGLTLYVVYRRSQGKSLRERFTIPAEALGEPPEVEYGSILVPVFGSPLDDDIMGTAGRLAAEEAEDEEGAIIEACYVLEMPMSVPIDASLPEERMQAARRALARAKEVGEEYEGVEVATFTVRGRTAGSAIVAEAKRRGVEAIVLAAEAPSRTRGGPLLGGLGGPRDKFADEVTRYVLEKAPSRVILTAAPAGEEGEREGVAP